MSFSYIEAHMRYLKELVATEGGTQAAIDRVATWFDVDRTTLGWVEPATPATPVRVIKSYAIVSPRR